MKYVKLFEAFLEEKIKKPKTFTVKGYTHIDENADTPKGQFVEFVLSQVEPKKDYKTLEEYTKAMIDIALSQYSFGGNDQDAKFIQDFCEENWNDETPNDKVEEDGDKERYAKVVKDIDEVRPRMAPAPKTDGMMASQGTKFFELYLQDEASYVCVDKYGYEKGMKNWEWMIDQSSGVMFAATAKIANEKYKMLKDLGILDSYGKDGGERNYFERSYFDLWKEWKEAMKSGKLKQAA